MMLCKSSILIPPMSLAIHKVPSSISFMSYIWSAINECGLLDSCLKMVNSSVLGLSSPSP